MELDNWLKYAIFMVALFKLCKPQELRYLGALPMNYPGFSIQYDNGPTDDPTERYSILQTTFSATTEQREDIFMIEYPGKCLDDPTSCEVFNVGDDFDWPRKPGQIPGMLLYSNTYFIGCITSVIVLQI